MHLRRFFLATWPADLLSQLELVISLRHVSVCARVDKTNGRVVDLRHRVASTPRKRIETNLPSINLFYCDHSKRNH